MATSVSPTVWRRWLALELRRLRREKGLAQQEAARTCGWSGARLSYLENGQQPPSSEDLDKLLVLYDVPVDERERYYTAVKRSHTSGWWERYEYLVDDWIALYVGLEQGAEEIHAFETLAMPGLLQTPEYTAALMRSGLRHRSPREIARLVELRTSRQAILSQGDESTKLDVVLDEALLYRSPVDVGVLRGQLAHVLEMAERPNVTVRILPFEKGLQTYAPGPFTILMFPWEQPDPGIVFVEYRGGSLYLEEFDEIERYTLAFDGLAEQALDPEASLAMVREAMEKGDHASE
jgi:transcriptional regulator with XRE-family HTH domain